MVDLVRQQVVAGQTYRFQITTGSMLPYLAPGDAVDVEPVAVADLRPGEIVLVGAGEVFLVHRLEEIAFGADGLRLLTRGDRNLVRDPPWAAAELVGRVARRHRQGQERDVRQGWGYWSCRTAGRLSRLERRLFLAVQPLARRAPGSSRWLARLVRGPFYRLAGWFSR